MAFLEINGLRKRFGSLEILKGIDLTLDKGGFLVLVGPSGCGKSTLLNTIAGLESISSGQIRIDGDVINDLHPSKRDIAMVFQSYALYPNMSVAQNMAFGMEMRGVPRQGGGGGRQNPANRTSQFASTQPAIGRPTPARGDGSRAGASTARVPVRRAVVQS